MPVVESRVSRAVSRPDTCQQLLVTQIHDFGPRGRIVRESGRFAGSLLRSTRCHSRLLRTDVVSRAGAAWAMHRDVESSLTTFSRSP